MATAADVEGFVTPNHDAKPENEGFQPVGDGAVNSRSKSESNRIHDLVFAMLQENPNPESGIQQAMKLLANMNEDLFQITKKIQERQFDEREAYNRLYRLEYKEKGFRSMWTDTGKRLAALKRDLDKLSFANNAYKERSIKTEDKINIHNLYFRMHHGTANMAEEKKLLKEANGSQKKLGDLCDSGPSLVEEITDRIWRLRWNIRRNYFVPRPAVMVDEKQVFREINELKWARDKAFANAPVKGKIWNSLPSKNVIKQQIKLTEESFCDEVRKEHLQLRAEIEAVKQQIDAAKKNIASSKRQLLDVRRKKGEAYKVILKLIKIQNQAIF